VVEDEKERTARKGWTKQKRRREICLIWLAICRSLGLGLPFVADTLGLVVRLTGTLTSSC